MRETTDSFLKPLDSTPRHDVRRSSKVFKARSEPISYSTLSVEAVSRLTSRHYGLQGPIECALFARGVNDVYLISTRQKKFALRVSHAGSRTRQVIEAELDALSYLGARGASVALPICRNDGAGITDIRAPEGARLSVLFHWAEGQVPKLSDRRHALLCGRHMAELHTASEEMPCDMNLPRLNLEHLLIRPARLIRPKLERWPSMAQRLDALVERLERRVTGGADLLRDQGFCHGDVHSGNVRIQGDRVVSFDFDACGTSWRLYDLASYKWEARRRGVEELAWRPFIEGYLQLRPAAADSLSLADIFLILRHLWLVSEWILFTSIIGQGLLADEFFETLVPFCEEIESGAPGAFQTFYTTWPTQPSIA